MYNNVTTHLVIYRETFCSFSRK